MTRVKICGLTREEDVDVAVDAGSDAVGFISGFPDSPRNLVMARAASLISRVPPFVTAVLVTTTEALLLDSETVKRAAPKAIQLYGDVLSPSTVRSTLHAHLVRPFHVGQEERIGSNGSGHTTEVLARRARETASGYDALLIDTLRKGFDG